jgi:hypothetical protein
MTTDRFLAPTPFGLAQRNQRVPPANEGSSASSHHGGRDGDRAFPVAEEDGRSGLAVGGQEHADAGVGEVLEVGRSELLAIAAEHDLVERD